jgi:hypothetical protein
MKKHVTRTRLTLDPQTIRHLDVADLGVAVGGRPRDSSDCSRTDCITCQTCMPGCSK